MPKQAQMAQLHERGAQLRAAKTAQERADAFSDFYLPVTPPESGLLLYTLVRATRPALVVEFGTSLGALHNSSGQRGPGQRQRAGGDHRAQRRQGRRRPEDLRRGVGLDDLITVLAGDATQTLATIDETVGGFVLLDGWKDLYVPVVQVLEPRLSDGGALVVADNTGLADAQPYVEYVRDPANGFVGVSFPVRDSDAMEISCRV